MGRRLALCQRSKISHVKLQTGSRPAADGICRLYRRGWKERHERSQKLPLRREVRPVARDCDALHDADIREIVAGRIMLAGTIVPKRQGSVCPTESALIFW